MKVVAFENSRGLHLMPPGELLLAEEVEQQADRDPQTDIPGNPGITNPGTRSQRRLAVETPTGLIAPPPLRRRGRSTATQYVAGTERRRRPETVNLYAQTLALVALMPPSEHLEWFCQDSVSMAMTHKSLRDMRDSNPMFNGIEIQEVADEEGRNFLVAIHNYRA